MNGKKFTLIELLITIAIIAILAGILMPALNSARKKANAILCVGNLKQIGTGLSVYLADFDDYFGPQDANIFGTAEKGKAIEKPPYFGTYKIFECESDDVKRSSVYVTKHGPYYKVSYYRNGFITITSGVNSILRVKDYISSKNGASNMVVFSEGWVYCRWYVANASDWSPSTQNSADHRPRILRDDASDEEFYMHQQGSNALWGDMHLAYLPESRMAKEKATPGHGPVYNALHCKNNKEN